MSSACEVQLKNHEQRVERYNDALRAIGESLEKATNGSYTMTSFLADAKLFLDRIRINSEGRYPTNLHILEDEFGRDMFLKELKKNVIGNSNYFGAGESRNISTQEENVYGHLNLKSEDFRKWMETQFQVMGHEIMENSLAFENELDFIDKDGKKYNFAELTEKYGYADWNKDFAKLVKAMEDGKEFYEKNGVYEITKDNPLMETFMKYIELEFEHIDENFGVLDKGRKSSKLLSKHISVHKLLDMGTVGKKVNNFLHGEKRIIYTESEYESAFQNFFKKFNPSLQSAIDRNMVAGYKQSNEEIARNLFDTLTGNVFRKKGTGMFEGVGKSYAEHDNLFNLSRAYSKIYEELEDELVANYFKDEVELMSSGIKSVFKEKHMKKMFGDNIDDTIKKVDTFIKDNEPAGRMKEDKIKNLIEFKNFVKDVYKNTDTNQILSDNIIANAYRVFISKIAVPLSLIRSALNHGMDGTFMTIKYQMMHKGKFDPKLAAKLFFTVTRNYTHLPFRIGFATVAALAPGKTALNVIKHVSKALDWSTMRNLPMEEKVKFISELRMSLDEYGYDVSKKSDIGSGFLSKFHDAFGKVTAIDVQDKLNAQFARQYGDNIIQEIASNIETGKELLPAHKKLLEKNGITEDMFRFYINKDKHPEKDPFNEDNIDLALDKMIPKSVKDLNQVQKADYAKHVMTSFIQEMVGSLGKPTDINKEQSLKMLFHEAIKDKGLPLPSDDLIFKVRRNFFSEELEVSIDREKASKLNYSENNLQSMEKEYSRLLNKTVNENARDFLEDVIAEEFGPLNGFARASYRMHLKKKGISSIDKDIERYFTNLYAHDNEAKTKNAKNYIQTELDKITGLQMHLERLFSSPRTEVGIKRALNGLDPRYYNILSSIVRAKTMFVGVSARSVEQFSEIAGYMLENRRDTETGKIQKFKLAKDIASVAPVLVIFSAYAGLLYNIKQEVFGNPNDTDWSPGAIMKLGSKDDVSIAAYTALINDYDSFASKTLYDLTTGRYKSFFRMLQSNPVLYNRIIANTLENN